MRFKLALRSAPFGALLAVAAVWQAAPLAAQDVKPVPRERTLIHIGWTAGSPTLTRGTGTVSLTAL